jgi:hypothetical protein
MPVKPTYWVRSKQTNEIGDFGSTPIPARFEDLGQAKAYQRQMNLRRGPFHPGYFIDQENSAPVLTRGIDADGYSVSKVVPKAVRFPTG